MGMSIDEIIQGTQIIKAQAEWDYPLDWQIVLDGAIDTMRKYKKIEQIYREWFSDTGRTSADAYARIGEVIKDGNDD